MLKLVKPSKKYLDSFAKVINEYKKDKNKLKEITQKNLFTILGQRTKMVPSDDPTRPVALINIMYNPRGLTIEEELVFWASKSYNVIIVEHDGSKFEYPGLKVLHDYYVNNNITVPAMYIHSKGAYHIRKESEACRRMWRYEFLKRKREYLEAINTAGPMIAAPYQGELHRNWNGIAILPGEIYNIPYENGWIANAEAVRRMNVFISSNRYDYEVVIYKGIPMVGMRMQHIAGENIPERRKITAEIMTFERAS